MPHLFLAMLLRSKISAINLVSRLILLPLRMMAKSQELLYVTACHAEQEIEEPQEFKFKVRVH